MGLSFHRQHPLALAIVDSEKKEVLECQTTQELLSRGKAQYIRQHSQKKLLIHARSGKVTSQWGKTLHSP